MLSTAQPPFLAVVPQTALNHLQLYALNISSEALWRLPDGQEVRRVNVYLSYSIHLDYGAVHISDLGGDAKSLLVALSNGTMQVFSWQGKGRQHVQLGSWPWTNKCAGAGCSLHMLVAFYFVCVCVCVCVMPWTART